MLLDFVSEGLAGIGRRALAIAGRLIILQLLVECLADEVAPGHEIESVYREGLGVDGALGFVRASIAYSYTCQVDPRHVLISRVRVVVDDLACQCRDVDSCIALSGKVELVVHVLFELQEEGHQSLHVVARNLVVVRRRCRPIGEPHAGRRLDVKHVREISPRFRVRLPIACATLEHERPVLVESAF